MFLYYYYLFALPVKVLREGRKCVSEEYPPASFFRSSDCAHLLESVVSSFEWESVCVCCWPIAHFGLLDWLLFPFYLLLPSFADRIINLTIELIGEIKWASRNCCWEWVWAKKWVSACALAFFACCLIFYLALYSLRCCCCWSVCTTRAHTKAAIICSLFAPISIFHY